MDFINWIFRAVPSLAALFLDYKFLSAFLSEYPHGISFPLTVLPTIKRKRELGLRYQHVVCVPEAQI
jgi:hypothetical protein